MAPAYFVSGTGTDVGKTVAAAYLQLALGADYWKPVQAGDLDHGDRDRVTCRDDGCGMSYQHARRFLFALYASSKEASREQAGKFGIGFWSVLRFEPSTIVIRSRPSRGPSPRCA